jgi:hypothetical protein
MIYPGGEDREESVPARVINSVGALFFAAEGDARQGALEGVP